jgi:hypothetical protein
VSGAPSSLAERIDSLRRVLDLGAGIVSDDVAGLADAAIEHATDRLRHGTDFTVVALAGATGSGKSSLFNAVVGEDIAPAGLTRPTTSEARAAVFGPADAGPLLEWLGVRHRHGVDGKSTLDGLVLIDLPDHDSVEVSHRLQVDHFVEHVDLLIWVLDPQKYADQALHERYLSQLSVHGGVMSFLLHQADLVVESGHDAWRDDAVRLLTAAGLTEPSVILTSTVTGRGLDEFAALLAARIGARRGALARIDADLKKVAAGLGELRTPPAEKDSRSGRRDLAAGLGDAAGSAAVSSAVAAAFRHDAALATGWPFTRWLRRFRRHPLRKLRPPTGARPGPQTAIPIDEPRLQLALKEYADRRAGDAPPAWARKLRTAAATHRTDLVGELGARITTVAGTATAGPRWWAAVGWLQRILGITAVAGGIWLLILLILDWLRIPADRLTPEIGGWPIPTLLLLGGAALGLLVAAAAGLFAGFGARRRARRAGKQVITAIEDVASRLVVAPVDAELERWATMAAAVASVEGN